MTTTNDNARETIVVSFDDELTVIDDDIRDSASDKICIYNLDGRLIVCCQRNEFGKVFSQLPLGVFIVNGKKLIKTNGN